MSRRDSESSAESFLETPLTAEQRSVLEAMASGGTPTSTVQTQRVQYVTPFPEPGTPGAPYFSGSDITDFLSRFQRLGKKHGITEGELIEMLPDYCERGKRSRIRAQAAYAKRDWEELKTQLSSAFQAQDSHQHLYSRRFLKEYRKIERGEDDDLEAYSAMFKNMLDNLKLRKLMSEVERTELFLEGLPERTKAKVMKKLSVDPESPDTMKFDAICALVTKEAQEAKRRNMVGGLVNKEAVRELIQQQEVPLESDHIVVRTDGTLPSAPRKLPGIGGEKKEMKFVKKEGTKKTGESGTDSKLDALTKQMESLVLAVNTIKEDQAVLKQNRPFIARRPDGAPAPAFPGRMGWNCFGCGGTGHSIFSCPEIGELCEKGIIHRDNQGRLCWGKAESGGAPVVRPMNGGTWKEEILKQGKLKDQMAAARVDVALVGEADVAFDTGDVNVQPFLICSPGNENDAGDTDEEFLDPDCCDELDVLAAGLDNARKVKQQESALEKGKRVIEGRIEKEKLYTAPKVLRNGDYVDAPKRVKPRAEEEVEEIPRLDLKPLSLRPTVEEVEEPLQEDVVMIDKPEKKKAAPKGKKLSKELKNSAKEASEKLLMALMNTEVKGLTIKDLLGASPLLHKMVFQNFPPETGEEAKEVAEVSVSEALVAGEDEERSQLWAVGTLKFEVIIGSGVVRAMFDSGAEVNILLYPIALSLGLAVRTNVTVRMKGAGNHKSPFIGYVPDVPVKIGDVIVRQPFFVLERGSTSCILGRPFETVTRMLRQTMNDGSVQLTIFDSEDDSCQTTFQVYKPGDAGDKRGYEMVRGPIHRNLN